MTRYTLVEHEKLPNFVVAAHITSTLEAKAKQHMGVIFDEWAKADTAADEINDWACVQITDGEPPIHPNRTAHLIGFSSKCRVDGRRLYIPLNTPATAIKEN